MINWHSFSAASCKVVFSRRHSKPFFPPIEKNIIIRTLIEVTRKLINKMIKAKLYLAKNSLCCTKRLIIFFSKCLHAHKLSFCVILFQFAFTIQKIYLAWMETNLPDKVHFILFTMNSKCKNPILYWVKSRPVSLISIWVEKLGKFKNRLWTKIVFRTYNNCLKWKLGCDNALKGLLRLQIWMNKQRQYIWCIRDAVS